MPTTNLIAQLKKIEVKADSTWKQASREFLLSRINAHQAFQRVAAANTKFDLANIRQNVRLAWQPVAVYALLVVIFLSGSGYVVSAARNSTPGDSLFSVKVALEKAEGLTKLNTATQTTFASAVLGNRVNDLEKVIAKNEELAPSDNKQTNTLILAVNEIKKQLDRVDSQFAKMQAKTEADNTKFALTAFDLNKKIVSYKENLEDVKEKIIDEEVGTEINEALARAEEINCNVLAIIIDKHEQGESAINENELADSLESHVKQIEDKVAQIEADIETKIEVSENKAELKAKASAAKATIAKASAALENNEYSLVLSLSNDSNAILQLLYGEVYQVIKNKQAENNEGVVEGLETVLEEENSTTTPAQNIELDEAPVVPIIKQVENEEAAETVIEPEEFKVGIE